jgi:hypothetical protein
MQDLKGRITVKLRCVYPHLGLMTKKSVKFHTKFLNGTIIVHMVDVTLSFGEAVP